jgi:hypothetical protein
MELLTAFIDEGKKTNPYEKKVAVFGINVGVNNVDKLAYNFISGLGNNKMKVFDTESEAKEWLVKK